MKLSVRQSAMPPGVGLLLGDRADRDSFPEKPKRVTSDTQVTEGGFS